ncbi:hypothetical protein N9948_00930 [bacterium]|nr:hypothetical protein [bacterium]
MLKVGDKVLFSKYKAKHQRIGNITSVLVINDTQFKYEIESEGLTYNITTYRHIPKGKRRIKLIPNSFDFIMKD